MTDRRGAAAADDGSAGEALTDLYAAHWTGLVRLAWLLVRDAVRAEDVVQDAFVASYPRLPCLREEGTALAYLRRAVVNGCRSGFRHEAVENRFLTSERTRPDLPGRLSAASAEAVAALNHAAADLLDAVHALPQRQREVMVLRYYADLTEQQIADALDISTGSVKTHASRALDALRSSLEGAS